MKNYFQGVILVKKNIIEKIIISHDDKGLTKIAFSDIEFTGETYKNEKLVYINAFFNSEERMEELQCILLKDTLSENEQYITGIWNINNLRSETSANRGRIILGNFINRKESNLVPKVIKLIDNRLESYFEETEFINGIRKFLRVDEPPILNNGISDIDNKLLILTNKLEEVSNYNIDVLRKLDEFVERKSFNKPERTSWILLKTKVAKGKIEEVIDKLNEHVLEIENKEIINALILTTSDYSRLKNWELTNTQSFENIELKRSIINNNILKLIDEIQTSKKCRRKSVKKWTLLEGFIAKIHGNYPC